MTARSHDRVGRSVSVAILTRRVSEAIDQRTFKVLPMRLSTSQTGNSYLRLAGNKKSLKAVACGSKKLKTFVKLLSDFRSLSRLRRSLSAMAASNFLRASVPSQHAPTAKSLFDHRVARRVGCDVHLTGPPPTSGFQNTRVRATHRLSNHCRQLALASVHFETNRRKFAGSYFSSFPTGQAMSADEGSIVALLPYLEQVQLGGDLGRASLTFSREHAAQLAQRPSFLSCPSNLPPAKLVGLAPWFSSPDVEPILVVAPAEYVLCSGVFPLVESSFERSKGIFGIEVPGKLHPRGDSEVLDGYSNTIGGWETRGDALILPDGRRFDFDANVPSSYPFWISDSEFVLASGPGTTKAWVYGWSGLAAGTLNQFSPSGHRLSWHAENLGGRSVNVTNLNSGPMSLHLGGVNRWMLDGSASFLSADVDSQVLMRMCTIAGEEGHE